MSYEYQYSDRIGLPWVIENMPNYLFPDLAKKKDRIQKRFHGVIATEHKRPVGLILSTFNQSGTSVRVHSFLVHPEHRDQGVGTKLLAELEGAVQKQGATQIEGHFRSHWPSASVLRKLLQRRQWTTPKEDLIIVKGESRKALPAFNEYENALQAPYRFSNYHDISVGQRSDIANKMNKGSVPAYLDPFVEQSSVFSPASIFLLHGDQVVGWVISHLITPDLNEFTALYVDEAHRSFKQTHLLMREGIFQTHRSGISNYLITAKSSNRIMSKFLRRHADSAELFVTQSFRTFKKI